jgi:hypothetical protein
MRFLLWFLVCVAAASESTPSHDERENLEASAYIGISIDSFAASELNQYINPDVSTKLKERAVAGFDFGYRLLGDPATPKAHQLWLYGETIHGMRSADVDCSANPSVPVCAGNVKPDADFLYLLRGASSLEALAGLRWEFAALNAQSTHPARAYLNAQFGFVSVAGAGQDVSGLHHLGLGVVAVNGRFSGSHLEAGHGKSDFFSQRRNNRVKIDGYLTWKPGWQWMQSLGLRPFAQMTVDTDAGPHADSIQTYLGLNFDVDRIFASDAK